MPVGYEKVWFLVAVCGRECGCEPRGDPNALVPGVVFCFGIGKVVCVVSFCLSKRSKW